MNAEDTDYLRLSDADPDSFSNNSPVLRLMLEGPWHKMTRSHILEEWSSDSRSARPHSCPLRRGAG